MADAKSGSKSDTPKATSTSAKGKLAPASESGDPAVHALLAQLQTAQQNGQDDAVRDVTQKLEDLGYSA